MDAPILKDLLAKSGAWLQGKGLPNGRREAEWIFSDSLGLSRMDLYLRWDMPLSPVEVDRLRERIARRARREPLAYILGTQPFGDLVLQVGPGVLVPRPETEELIPLVLADATPGARLLDVGTGSGAIALACAKARPDLRVEATEVSEDALSIARANAQRLDLSVTFHRGDLATHLTGPFQVVVANLPYIGETERGDCDPELAFEPAGALFSGADGLDLIRRFVADLPRLCPGGVVWLEHGWRQGPAIAALATAAGLSSRLVLDGAGKERFTRIGVP